MFIERDLQHTSSLQRSETEARLAYHCRKHCAPLERRSALLTGFYNIWLRWSQRHYLVAA